MLQRNMGSATYVKRNPDAPQPRPTVVASAAPSVAETTAARG